MKPPRRLSLWSSSRSGGRDGRDDQGAEGRRGVPDWPGSALHAGPVQAVVHPPQQEPGDQREGAHAAGAAQHPQGEQGVNPTALAD